MKNFNYLFVLFFSLIFIKSYAQLEFKEHLVTDESFENKADEIFTLDIDNDGDMDVITSSIGGFGQDGFFNGTIRLYENIDDSLMFKLHFIATPNDVLDIDVVDFDGDGDADIVAIIEDRFHIGGNGYRTEKRIIWYENTGDKSNFSSRKNLDTLNFTSLENFITADIDNDNDLDIVLTYTSGNAPDKYYTITWLENKGNSDLTVTHFIDRSDTAFQLYEEAADLDNDQDLDILIYNSHGIFKWYRNNSDGSFDTVNTNINSQSSEIKLGDLDADGKIDVVGHSIREENIVWYKNINNFESFNPAITISSSPKLSHHLNLADMDNDNDLDVVYGYAGDTKTVWNENSDEMGNFNTEHTISTVTNHFKVHMADMDKDGHIDLVTNEKEGIHTSIYIYSKNHEQNNFNPRINISDFPEGISNTFVLDADGDGYLDIIGNSASQSEQKIVLFRNLDGLGDFGNQITIDTNLIGCIAKVGDIDNDGDTDFLFRESNKGTFWYENTTGTSFIKHNISGILEEIHDLKDLDDDGDLDVLVSKERAFNDHARVFYWHVNDGTGNFTTTDEIYATEKRQYFPTPIKTFAEDINNDGKLDLVLAYTGGDENKENIRIVWLKNSNGFKTFEAERIITISDRGLIQNIAIGDIDGDNDLDIIYTKGIHPYFVKNSDGLGNFDLPQRISNESESVLYLSDVDGDNDLDIISGKQAVRDGHFGWYENIDGTGTFATKKIISNTLSHPNHIRMEDIDGDGDKDIVVSSYYQSKISWFENLGDLSTLSNEAYELTNFSLYPNPGQYNVHINSKTPIQKVIFYTISGKEIKTSTFNNRILDYDFNISELANGIYFIRVHSSQNQKTIKFIKK